MSRRWSARDVRPMAGDQERFQHVARHLYQPAERWDHVIPDLGDVRRCAWDCGCSESLLDGPYPDFERASPICRAHVIADHDRLLAPAYMSELLAAEGANRWGALPGASPGFLFVGDRGVTVVVRMVRMEDARTPKVMTAYRPIPGHGTSEADFFKKAVRKLRDKTSWEGK